MATSTIRTRQTGTRKINGTDWPVWSKLECLEYGRRVEWVVTKGICHGVSGETKIYLTRSAALAEFMTA
jgi:hypothetical protein